MLYDGMRIGEGMANGNEPATKADLNRVEEKLGAGLNRVEEQLRSEFQHGFDHLAEAIHDSEMRLLKAFYTFAESNQQRLTQVEGNTTAVISRLATLESRITEIEKRLNMPPAA
jgi:4-hydroxyphenylpyruvate dioxygenase-like putative hemolysin